MRSFVKMQSLCKGVLLMEALVALLLFVSMTTIVSSYWHHLSLIRAHTSQQLQALSQARNAVEQLIITRTEYTDDEHAIAYHYNPATLKTSIDLALPAVSLVSIEVSGVSKKKVCLKTFYGE